MKKKLFLLAVSVMVVLSALCFGVGAEDVETAKPTMKISHARLVLGNQVYIQYGRKDRPQVYCDRHAERA